MKNLVCSGAGLQCSFGQFPAVLTILPVTKVTIGGRPVATVGDTIPLLNIASFGMCSCTANPAVAAATAAAGGVPTSAPCLPVPAGAWTDPAQKVKVNKKAPLTQNSKLQCAWGGEITVKFAGQSGVNV